jgi:hypothetical protein
MTSSYLRYLRAYGRSLLAGRRQKGLFDQVEMYCMFLGHGRSGHSLVGALLNAHPDAVIAHELDAFFFLNYGISRDQLYALILERDKWFTQQSGSQWTEFNYAVPHQWQGRFRTLRIIGDKKGGPSSQRLRKNPELFPKLRRLVNMPTRIVQVLRNPFDNIATMARRSNRSLELTCEKYFKICETNRQIMAQCDPDEAITLRHEEVIADPKGELRKLWGFLDLPCTEDYLKDCASIIYSSPSKTRLKTEWSAGLRQNVQDQINRYEFLQGYTFDS